MAFHLRSDYVQTFIRVGLMQRVSLIVTSRPAAVDSFFDREQGFTAYELAGLDDEMKVSSTPIPRALCGLAPHTQLITFANVAFRITWLVTGSRSAS